MLEFLSLKKEAFGLDISDLSLKIVKLKKKRKIINLDCFFTTQLPEEIIEGGEIKDEDKLIDLIKQVIKKMGWKKLKTKYVVASLPEEKSFLQVIQMPPMLEEDLKSAIRFEAENYIPLPVDQVYLDFQVISSPRPDSKKQEVLIAALPKKIVDPYLSVLKKSGLEPIAFEVESQAISRALINQEKVNYPVLIVDLGATRTSFIFYFSGFVRFTSSIPISGNNFTEIIAKNLKISWEKAEELKKMQGLGEKIEIEFKAETVKVKKERGGLFEILIPPLVDLVQQIKHCLDFYETHISSSFFSSEQKQIKKIILCGGGANLKGLLEFLNLELKIPVELGSPWVNISEKALLGLEDSLKLTCAIGLALRGISEYD